VAAIGLSGQMHGTVLLGQDGQPVTPAVIWPDQRSARQVQEITELIGSERLIEITGSPVATGFQAATLRWVQQQRPDLWARTRHALLPKDYIRLRLTGELASDPSDGSGALLLDVRARDWSAELLDALGIPRSWLPPIQASASVAGGLRPEAAAALGLPADTPVVTGAADTACSALGAGAVHPGRLLLTISTGGQLILPVEQVQVDQRGRIHTFCAALEPGPGLAAWYQMGAVLSAGMALRWLRDNVLGLAGEDAYARMTGWAGDAGPGANGLLFLPYLAGERTPHMDPAAKGLFLGLTLQHGRGELVRAVLEGVTFACFDAFRALAELGPPPAQVILAGGGAKSALWRQIVADVFGRPVRPLQVSEQSALGACALAGLGAGLVDLAQVVDGWVAYGEPVAPDPARHAFYEERFELYQEAYARNRGVFARL
jgi:xylulokinase